MKVPLLDLTAQHRTIRDEVMEAVNRIFETQQFILGREVEEFERAAADYCGVKHAIGCASGSDALLLALMALDIGPGDEVITTPFTFFATGSAVTRLGAKPVFVDISPDDFNIDTRLIDDAVSTRTRAIMPVHLYGQCAGMDEILEIAGKRNIPVVEDAAQAIGSDFKGRAAGSMGLIGSFSFFPTKNLGGAGEGGLMTTNDDGIAEKLRISRVHGMEPKYYHKMVGINSRLDALQAAVLKVKLKYLDGWNESRRSNAARYDELFENKGIKGLKTPTVHEDSWHIFHQYTIRCRRRDALKEYLYQAGIGTEVYYPVPLHLQECFTFLEYQPGDLPQSEMAALECLSLPVYPELTQEQQELVVDTIANFYKETV